MMWHVKNCLQSIIPIHGKYFGNEVHPINLQSDDMVLLPKFPVYLWSSATDSSLSSPGHHTPPTAENALPWTCLLSAEWWWTSTSDRSLRIWQKPPVINVTVFRWYIFFHPPFPGECIPILLCGSVCVCIVAYSDDLIFSLSSGRTRTSRRTCDWWPCVRI